MTGLERIRAAVAHAPADVVPWHAMLKAVYKAHIKDIKDQGLMALLHICGKSNDILEGVAETGADIFESLDPPSLGGAVRGHGRVPP
jgi:hypothetical protein